MGENERSSDDVGVVIPFGSMAQINRVADQERLKRQLEENLDHAERAKLRAELLLTTRIREAVKELADAQAKVAFAREKLESLFPPLGAA